MTSAERPSPLLDIPADATPGDVFRAIADWYDKTGEPMPNRIVLNRHTREDRVADGAYLAAFRERYDLPMHPLSDKERAATPTRWAELTLVDLPNVDATVVNFAVSL